MRVAPDRLRADLDALETEHWAAQDRYGQREGGWDGIALYSVSGAAEDLRCAGRTGLVKKTPAADKCPYTCDVLLPQFGAALLRVALYRLRAGAVIGVHTDYGENRSMGYVRIHVPVVTNDGVVIYVAGQEFRFGAGEAWYFDASCPHQVENRGSEDRIHLIADFRPSPTLNALLRRLPPGGDRIRFARHRLVYYGKVIEAFVQFAKTPEGRARIRAKVRSLRLAPAGLTPGALGARFRPAAAGSTGTA